MERNELNPNLDKTNITLDFFPSFIFGSWPNGLSFQILLWIQIFFFFLNQFLLLPFCWPLNFDSSLFICNPRCVSSTIKKYCHQNPVWEKETKTKTKQHVYSLKWKVFVNNRDVSSMFCLCSFVLKTLFIQLFSSLSLILFLVPPAFLYFSLSCH